MKKRWLALLLIVVLVGGSAIGISSIRNDDKDSDKGGSSSASSDVPEVVAEVNGEEISDKEFTEVYDAQVSALEAQAAAGGEAPDAEALRDEVVQSLVTEELLAQEVAERDIEVTDKQVQQTLSDLATENGLESADAFISALEEQGLDREQINEEARQRTQFDTLIAEEAGELEATDKEVRELYSQLKEQQKAAAQAGQEGQEIPPLKDVRTELEDQVTSQQESQAATDLIDGLREQAEITINL